MVCVLSCSTRHLCLIACMIVAMVPLLLASGPGAVSRFDIGLVIATGLGIGTLFTLFVLPAVYLILSDRGLKGKLPAPLEATATS